MNIRRRLFFVFAFALTFISIFVIQTHAGVPLQSGFSESIFANDPANLANATSMVWAPDGSNRLFITRKTGQIRIIQNGVLLPTPFITESPYTNSECGLLSMVFDPNYISNHFVYVFITVSASEQQIYRYTDSNNVGTGKTLIMGGLPTRGVNHDGGTMGIGFDGKLYFGIGDNGAGIGVDNDLSTLASKISRINLNGTIPNDNPFYDGAGPNADAIWARGFRNPYTMTFHPKTGSLFLNDVGTSVEQVFNVTKGGHGGWNDYEGNQPSGYLTPKIQYKTGGSFVYNIAASNGAVRVSNQVTYTTTTIHNMRQGTKVTVAGVSNSTLNGTFYISSIPSATKFKVNQTGPNATSGGGTVTTLNIGRAVLGGCFYDSTAFASGYQGNFFFGDYVSGNMVRATMTSSLNATSVDLFATNIPAYVDCCTGPDGALYYSTADGAGKVYRLSYNNTSQKLIVWPTGINMSENGYARFMVRLATSTTSNIVVNTTYRTGDTNTVINKGKSLTFSSSNWSTPQIVELFAKKDSDTANSKTDFTVSSGSLSSVIVSANVIDIDTSGLILSAAQLFTKEGTTNSFTVKLSSAPSSNVTVNVKRSSGDSSIVPIGTTNFVFTPSNFASAQTVKILSGEDSDSTDDSAIISLAAAGYTTRTVQVFSDDNDPAAPIFVSTPPTNAVVGALYQYQMKANGNPNPTYSLTTKPAGMTVDSVSGIVSWTPTAPGTFTVTGVASNGISPNAVQTWDLHSRNDAAPVASLTKPTAGETISGTTSEFFGDGIDDVGCVKAEFYVDGVLKYTDVNNSGHYHYGGAHLLFDTTQFSNGPHTLKMTVYDTKGQIGSAQVNVTISN